jgi:hypothetical protein
LFPPGEFNMARKNHAWFLPAFPGREEDSWKHPHDEALDHFFAGQQTGAYETARVKVFDDRLPEKAKG